MRIPPDFFTPQMTYNMQCEIAAGVCRMWNADWRDEDLKKYHADSYLLLERFMKMIQEYNKEEKE